MNSDKLDMLLFTRHYLQNLDFHLIEVPVIKLIEKRKKEMERTFRLREESFTFDKKGMILKGEIVKDRQGIFVRAWDIYLNNKDIMSDDEVKDCFARGIYYKWSYQISELEPLETIKITQLDYDMLKFLQKQGAKYICRDEGGVLNICGTEPYQSKYEEGVWWSTGEMACLNKFFSKLFQFVKWEDKKYYVIEDVLNNCEVVEDENAQ